MATTRSIDALAWWRGFSTPPTLGATPPTLGAERAAEQTVSAPARCAYCCDRDRVADRWDSTRFVEVVIGCLACGREAGA